MHRLRIAVAILIFAVVGWVSPPVQAASMWRAWQGCGSVTQFGNWVTHDGVSYTPYCHGYVGAHGCSGGPTLCYLYWQNDGSGHYRTAAVPM